MVNYHGFPEYIQFGSFRFSFVDFTFILPYFYSILWLLAH